MFDSVSNSTNVNFTICKPQNYHHHKFWYISINKTNNNNNNQHRRAFLLYSAFHTINCVISSLLYSCISTFTFHRSVNEDIVFSLYKTPWTQTFLFEFMYDFSFFIVIALPLCGRPNSDRFFKLDVTVSISIRYTCGKTSVFFLPSSRTCFECNPNENAQANVLSIKFLQLNHLHHEHVSRLFILACVKNYTTILVFI